MRSSVNTAYIDIAEVHVVDITVQDKALFHFKTRHMFMSIDCPNYRVTCSLTSMA